MRRLAERYAARGRAHLDLSVLHSNSGAIALYRKLGFSPTAAVCVKRKNPINQALYSPRPAGLEDVNPYARIIADEALRRGLRVEVTDAPSGELRISSGARSVLTRESLSELTSAVAMSRCDDKRVTARLLAGAGLAVPRAAETDAHSRRLMRVDAVPPTAASASSTRSRRSRRPRRPRPSRCPSRPRPTRSRPRSGRSGSSAFCCGM